MLGEALDFTQGIVAEGEIDMPESASPFTSGLYIEADGSGFGVRPTRAGLVEFGTIDSAGENWGLRKDADRSRKFGITAKFRLYARRGMLELYLDDHFIECVTLRCPVAKMVHVGIFGAKHPVSPVGFGLWRMSL
jgi:hypothetical protein